MSTLPDFVNDIRITFVNNESQVSDWVKSYLVPRAMMLTVAREVSEKGEPHIHICAANCSLNLEAIRKHFITKFPKYKDIKNNPTYKNRYYMKKRSDVLHKLQYNNKGKEILLTNGITKAQAIEYGTAYKPQKALNRKGLPNYQAVLTEVHKQLLPKNDEIFHSIETIANAVYDFYVEHKLPIDHRGMAKAVETINAWLNNEHGRERFKQYLGL